VPKAVSILWSVKEDVALAILLLVPTTGILLALAQYFPWGALMALALMAFLAGYAGFVWGVGIGKLGRK
jgi:hydrogenase/urease accessory protein HupE